MQEYELKVLEQYDVNVKGTRKTRGAFFCDTEQGLFLLKEAGISEKRVPALYRLGELLKKAGYAYVDQILPNAEVYVEFVKDKVVGFIGIIDNHIEGIFVDHHHQGNGVGTALLHEAKTSKYHLTLHVYKQNANAIRFYQKNDFVITEEHNDENTGEIECTMNWHQ